MFFDPSSPFRNVFLVTLTTASNLSINLWISKKNSQLVVNEDDNGKLRLERVDKFHTPLSENNGPY